jgi:23S rRNA pseudouridine1911/1915/1917 synthase
VAERVTHRVPPEAAGERLDRWLAGLHQELSRARLQSLIDEGHVLVDGAAARSAKKLRGGESIEVAIPDPVPAEPEAQELPLSILHEDGDLVVLDKAAGVVVHPASSVKDGTLVNALLFHVRDLGGIGGELRPGIVHRLDKETSGCLVVAKHERALVALQAAFKERVVDKRYLALVHGVPASAEFTLDTEYGRHPTDRIRFTTKRPTGRTRRAISHVTVVERFATASLLEVQLETGRTHQIRVHLSEAGHPLLADALYGGTKREAKLPPADPARLAAAAIGRQALHARVLAFPHPRSGERLRFEAPLPADFSAALVALRS